MHPGEDADTISHRGMDILVWRTDDPMEPPGDDPDAEGPFEIGDFYCAVPDWGLQVGASLSTVAQALGKARAAIDAVLDTGADPEAAMGMGGIPPLRLDDVTPAARPGR